MPAGRIGRVHSSAAKLDNDLAGILDHAGHLLGGWFGGSRVLDGGTPDRSKTDKTWQHPISVTHSHRDCGCCSTAACRACRGHYFPLRCAVRMLTRRTGAPETPTRPQNRGLASRPNNGPIPWRPIVPRPLFMGTPLVSRPSHPDNRSLEQRIAASHAK